MIRIIIEIDGTTVTSTSVQPDAGVTGPPPELLARAAAIGATDAGGAPAEIAGSATPFAGPATDAGAFKAPAQATAAAAAPKTRARRK